MPPSAGQTELIGYFSYAHADDEACAGALTKLRGLLEQELSGWPGRAWTDIRLVSGDDRVPHRPGADSKDAPARAVFCIAVVSPAMAGSAWCCQDIVAFLAHEMVLGRSDLIFPVLYADVPEMADGEARDGNPVVSVLAGRKFFDWRSFRSLDPDSAAVEQAARRLCQQVADVLLSLPPALIGGGKSAAAIAAEESRRRFDAEQRRRERERKKPGPPVESFDKPTPKIAREPGVRTGRWRRLLIPLVVMACVLSSDVYFRAIIMEMFNLSGSAEESAALPPPQVVLSSELREPAALGQRTCLGRVR